MYTSSMDENSMDKSSNLIWIDLEMTGLDTINDTIIEIATIVTDRNLNELAEGPVVAIGQPSSVMDAMDEWNTKQHAKSGLTEHVEPGTSPMCGNSICQDRRFLAREMPALEAFFHYRNLDVSTLKILAQQWAPEVAAGFVKESEHRALADIRDSINELAWYRESFLDGSVLTPPG